MLSSCQSVRSHGSKCKGRFNCFGRSHKTGQQWLLIGVIGTTTLFTDGRLHWTKMSPLPLCQSIGLLGLKCEVYLHVLSLLSVDVQPSLSWLYYTGPRVFGVAVWPFLHKGSSILHCTAHFAQLILSQDSLSLEITGFCQVCALLRQTILGAIMLFPQLFCFSPLNV